MPTSGIQRPAPASPRRHSLAPDAGGGARPLWQWLAALIPLASVAVAGGTARWNQALTLLAVGGMLVLAPPRVSAGRTIHLVLAGLILLAGAAFLPARWFAPPAWRAALTDDFGVALPATVSPQPILAAESLMLFLAGAGWFYLMLTFRWRAADRLRAGRVFAGGVVVLGGLFLVLHRLDIVPPIWENERHFGPFPNRNQTANFLAIGAIVTLACAQLRWQAGRRLEAAGWMIGLGVVLVSMFTSYSRAGVILFFAEAAAYLILEAYRSARRCRAVKAQEPRATGGGLRWAALAFSVLLLLVSLFLLFGGSTLERLWPTSAQAAGKAVTGEFRLRIQADAVGMIGASPWCGSGLSSFAEVFQGYRHRSAIPMRAIHPESDYLWMASELGWPSLLLIGVGLGWLALRVGWSVQVSGTGHDRRLRLAAGIGAAAFAAHGFIDVSGHRLGTVLCALFLLGLALKDVPADGEVAGRFFSRFARQPFAPLAGPWVTGFRLLGLLLVAVGTLWLVESRGHLLLPGRVGVERLRERTVREAAARDYAGAEDDATRALAWAPLDWELYYLRAGVRGSLGRDQDLVAEDFRCARYLEPFLGELPAGETLRWESLGEPARALSALGEAYRREPANADAYLSAAITQAGRDRTMLDQLARYARRDPTLLVTFLERCDAPESAGYLTAALDADPNLSRLDEAQKTGFFRAWFQHGNLAALAAAMPQHPDWQRAGWRFWAAAAANTDHLEQACAVATRWTPAPVQPPLDSVEVSSAQEIRRQAASHPLNPMSALQAYRVESDAGDWQGALAALQRISAQPGCPNYFHYLRAIAYGKLGDWKDAWEAWDRYFAAANL